MCCEIWCTSTHESSTLKVVPYTSGKIWSACLIFLFFLAVCLNVINIKSLTNSNQQTQSYKFTSHIAAFLSVVLITEMLEICIQTSYDQNFQLSYLPVVYGIPLRWQFTTYVHYTGITKPVEVGEILALYRLKSLSLDYKAKLKSPCFFLQVTLFLQIIFVLW